MLNLPSVPQPEAALDRAAILSAVAEAASAAAAGTPMPEGVRSLDGRQFEIRIRFGCRGPSPELGDRWLGWTYEPEKRTIRVRAMPTITREEPLLAQAGVEAFEAVEGFWIPRPWLLQPLCPATAAIRSGPAQATASSLGEAQQQDPDPRPDARPAEAVPGAPRVGIAQFFTQQDARTGRRDMRPYQAVYSLPEGKALSSQGYNLVLSGRLRALGDRGVVQCAARNADSPPECIVSAEFLRVWMEQPDSREVIAEWGGG